MAISKEKLQKLKDITKLVDSSMTPKEIISYLERIVKFAKDLEPKLLGKVDLDVSNKRQQIVGEFQNEVGNISQELRGQLASVTRSVEDVISNLDSKVNSKLTEVDRKISTIRNGIDGKDSDDKDVIKEVLKRVPVTKMDETKFEKFAEEMRGELKTGRLKGGGFSKIHMESKFVDDETPSGTVNGVNKAFTLTNTPNPPGSVKVFVNGSRMRITEDYTFSGNTITFVTAPPTTSILLVDYRV